MKKKIKYNVHYVVMDESDNKNDKYFANIHTHGLEDYGHRELCLLMNFQEDCRIIFSNLVHHIANGRTFKEGIYDDVLTDKYRIEIKTFPDDPVLYVIYPDEDNKLPSDEGCAYPWNLQYEYAKRFSEHMKELAQI